MRRTSVVRFLTSVIVVAFVMAGPLAPLAHAQQPAPAADTPQADEAQVQVDTAQAQPTTQVDTAQAQPAAPPQPTAPSQPAAPPPPPMQPDLFQEKLKSERGSDRSQGFYNAEAVIVNVFLVPGRVITCVAGGIVGVTILAVSFGSGYRPASYMFHEGCGGKWIVKGDDLRPDTPPSMVVTDPVR